MPSPTRHDSLRRGFEVADVPVRSVGFALIAIVGLLVVILAVLAAFYRFEVGRTLAGRPAPPGLTEVEVPPPGPHVLDDQLAQRQAIEADAAARLSGYGWVDRRAGIAHIPIDRAMAILAERGWPEVPQPEGGPAAEPVRHGEAP